MRFDVKKTLTLQVCKKYNDGLKKWLISCFFYSQLSA